VRRGVLVAIALAATACRASVDKLEADGDARALLDRAADPKDRAASIAALGRLADKRPDAAEDLAMLDEASPADPAIVKAMLDALDRNAPWADEQLRLALHRPDRVAHAVGICVATPQGCASFVPELEAAVRESKVSDDARDLALAALVAIGDRSGPTLGRLLADPREEIRSRVGAAVAKSAPQMTPTQRNAVYARLGDEPVDALARQLIDFAAKTDHEGALVSAVRRSREGVSAHVRAVTASDEVRCGTKAQVWSSAFSALDPSTFQKDLTQAASQLGKKCPAELHDALHQRLLFPGGAGSVVMLADAPEVLAALSVDECAALRDGLAPITDSDVRIAGQKVLGAVCEKAGK
jgi:hypothetical protein